MIAEHVMSIAEFFMPAPERNLTVNNRRHLGFCSGNHGVCLGLCQLAVGDFLGNLCLHVGDYRINHLLHCHTLARGNLRKRLT